MPEVKGHIHWFLHRAQPSAGHQVTEIAPGPALIRHKDWTLNNVLLCVSSLSLCPCSFLFSVTFSLSCFLFLFSFHFFVHPFKYSAYDSSMLALPLRCTGLEIDDRWGFISSCARARVSSSFRPEYLCWCPIFQPKGQKEDIQFN